MIQEKVVISSWSCTEFVETNGAIFRQKIANLFGLHQILPYLLLAFLFRLAISIHSRFWIDRKRNLSVSVTENREGCARVDLGMKNDNGAINGQISGMVSLADERIIAYLEGGDPQGYPVFGLHGTPGCRLARWFDDGIYTRAGIRYITTDRAGFGRSSRHKGRSVADEASDILAVADSLGIEHFSVVGGSGGGPHSLACGALLIDHVERVACQSSIAPLNDGGMNRKEWVKGMAQEHAIEISWAEGGEMELSDHIEIEQQMMMALISSNPSKLLGESMSKGDQDFLLRPEVTKVFNNVIAEQAVHGVGGWVDDIIAFTKPWGFDLSKIPVPVLITHGKEDMSAPLAHGIWLAKHIPNATIQINELGGHLPDYSGVEISATMRWLAGLTDA
jgi:pimeloyl-ACP methyl ester carboxylesterase